MTDPDPKATAQGDRTMTRPPLNRMRQQLLAALVHAQGGAFRTAAENIRAVADQLDEAAATRESMIDAALDEQPHD